MDSKNSEIVNGNTKKCDCHIFSHGNIKFCLVCKETITENVPDSSSGITDHLVSVKHAENVQSIFKICFAHPLCESRDMQYLDTVNNSDFYMSSISCDKSCYVIYKDDLFLCLICQEVISSSISDTLVIKDLVDHLNQDCHQTNIKNIVQWIFYIAFPHDFFIFNSSFLQCSSCYERTDISADDILLQMISSHLHDKHLESPLDTSAIQEGDDSTSFLNALEKPEENVNLSSGKSIHTMQLALNNLKIRQDPLKVNSYFVCVRNGSFYCKLCQESFEDVKSVLAHCHGLWHNRTLLEYAIDYVSNLEKNCLNRPKHRVDHELVLSSFTKESCLMPHTIYITYNTKKLYCLICKTFISVTDKKLKAHFFSDNHKLTVCKTVEDALNHSNQNDQSLSTIKSITLLENIKPSTSVCPTMESDALNISKNENLSDINNSNNFFMVIKDGKYICSVCKMIVPINKKVTVSFCAHINKIHNTEAVKIFQNAKCSIQDMNKFFSKMPQNLSIHCNLVVLVEELLFCTLCNELLVVSNDFDMACKDLECHFTGEKHELEFKTICQHLILKGDKSEVELVDIGKLFSNEQAVIIERILENQPALKTNIQYLVFDNNCYSCSLCRTEIRYSNRLHIMVVNLNMHFSGKPHKSKLKCMGSMNNKYRKKSYQSYNSFKGEVSIKNKISSLLPFDNSQQILQTEPIIDISNSNKSQQILQTESIKGTSNFDNCQQILQTESIKGTSNSNNNEQILQTESIKETSNSNNSHQILPTELIKETSHIKNSLQILQTESIKGTSNSNNSQQILQTESIKETSNIKNCQQILQTESNKENSSNIKNCQQILQTESIKENSNVEELSKKTNSTPNIYQTEIVQGLISDPGQIDLKTVLRKLSKKHGAVVLNKSYLIEKDNNYFCIVCNEIIKFTVNGSFLKSHCYSAAHNLKLSENATEYIKKQINPETKLFNFKDSNTIEKFETVISSLSGDTLLSSHLMFIDYNSDSFICTLCNLPIGFTPCGKRVIGHFYCSTHRLKTYELNVNKCSVSGDESCMINVPPRSKVHSKTSSRNEGLKSNTYTLDIEDPWKSKVSEDIAVPVYYSQEVTINSYSQDLIQFSDPITENMSSVPSSSQVYNRNITCNTNVMNIEEIKSEDLEKCPPYLSGNVSCMTSIPSSSKVYSQTCSSKENLTSNTNMLDFEHPWKIESSEDIDVKVEEESYYSSPENLIKFSDPIAENYCPGPSSSKVFNRNITCKRNLLNIEEMKSEELGEYPPYRSGDVSCMRDVPPSSKVNSKTCSSNENLISNTNMLEVDLPWKIESSEDMDVKVKEESHHSFPQNLIKFSDPIVSDYSPQPSSSVHTDYYYAKYSYNENTTCNGNLRNTEEMKSEDNNHWECPPENTFKILAILPDYYRQHKLITIEDNTVVCKLCNGIVSLNNNFEITCEELNKHLKNPYHSKQFQSYFKNGSGTFTNYSNEIDGYKLFEEFKGFETIMQTRPFIKGNLHYIKNICGSYMCTLCNIHFSKQPLLYNLMIQFNSHFAGKQHKLKSEKLNQENGTLARVDKTDLTNQEGHNAKPTKSCNESKHISQKFLLHLSKKDLIINLNIDYFKVKGSQLHCLVCHKLIISDTCESQMKEHCKSATHNEKLRLNVLNYRSELENVGVLMESVDISDKIKAIQEEMAQSYPFNRMTSLMLLLDVKKGFFTCLLCLKPLAGPNIIGHFLSKKHKDASFILNCDNKIDFLVSRYISKLNKTNSKASHKMQSLAKKHCVMLDNKNMIEVEDGMYYCKICEESVRSSKTGKLLLRHLKKHSKMLKET